MFKDQKKAFSVLVYTGIALLAASALFMLALFASELKSFGYIGQDVPAQHTIRVSGEGEATVIPDTTELSFAVVEESPSVGDAQAKVTETMNDILDWLDEYGVEDRHVKTTQYNISPRYEYRSNARTGIEIYPPRGERVLVGYEVTHRVEVKIPSTEGVGNIIGALGQRGATNISNVRFTVEDEESVRAEAREKAVEQAKTKAKNIAKALGVSLDRVVDFNESGIGFPQPRYATLEAADGAVGGAPAPEIPSGETTVTAQVSITYALE